MQKENIKSKLRHCFRIKDLGEVYHILGATITRDRKNGIISLDQSTYIKNMITSFNMQEGNETKTAFSTDQVLTMNTVLTMILKVRKKLDEFPIEAVVSLIYASQRTRSEVAYIVGTVSRYANNPGNPIGAQSKDNPMP
nr:uncharacterized protein LOC122272655 [Parasteatoda tepidariorum]